MADGFEKFMAKCRKEMASQSHGEITHEDEIYDWSWYDAYEDGMTPKEAVRRAFAAMRSY